MAFPPPEPTTDTVLDDLPFHLVRTSLALRRFNDRTLKAVGLGAQPPGLASLLHAVDEMRECTVARLVERTHLPNGTLTGLLDTLERDGCIARVDNEDDGRSWRIRLTRKGETLCRKLRQRHQVVMELFREVLSEEESKELKRLLARLTTCMRVYPADARPPRANAPKAEPRATPARRRTPVRASSTD